MRAQAGCFGVAGAWAVLLAWLVMARWPWVLWWTMGLAAAAFAVVWPIRRRQRRQLERFLTDKCLTCGYDLRGIGRSGRCPECGTPFEDVSPPAEEAA